MTATVCSCGHQAPPRRARRTYVGQHGTLVDLLHRRVALRKRLPLANCIDEWVRW